MRRRRRNHELLTVSLFPFLAVLICTFGVLIILLVIVVKAADHQAEVAQAEQDQIQQQDLDRLQLDLELQELKIKNYESSRPELLEKLSDEKTRRALIQANIDKIAREQRLLVGRMEALSSEKFDSDNQVEQEISSLQQQLADHKEMLDERRQAAATAAEVRYSIVPYDGEGGTTRRPIYIECRKHELILQPYGIMLTTKDFIRPILPNNPLDAALITTREYFLKNNLLDHGGTPYPLLVVRPGGSQSYALARQAMRSWDEEFGYELVASDKELAFGEPDYQLAEEMRIAIEAARNRQRKHVAKEFLLQRNRDNQIANAGGLRASKTIGGFEQVGNQREQVRRTSATETIAGTESQTKDKDSEALESGDSENSDAKRNADIAVRNLDGGESIADERGTNWALPSNAGAAVAYHRPVKLYLTGDQIVVEADSQNVNRLFIPIDGANLNASLEDLVEAIWQRIENWGVAGAGGYWKPELNVIVLPGSESKFIRMQQLLDESGFGIKKEKP